MTYAPTPETKAAVAEAFRLAEADADAARNLISNEYRDTYILTYLRVYFDVDEHD